MEQKLLFSCECCGIHNREYTTRNALYVMRSKHKKTQKHKRNAEKVRREKLAKDTNVTIDADTNQELV